MSLVTRWASSMRAERGRGPVPLVDPERCLRRYAPHTPCAQCAGGCPVSAVDLSVAGLCLGAGCIGCEACVTACPAGALTAPPEVVSQRRERLDAAARVVRFTCVRQPGRGAATVAFGCLAGLPLTTLLAPLTRTTCRVEVERGGCEECDLAATGASLATTLEQARALLAAFGIAPERIREVGTFSRDGEKEEGVVGRRELFLRLRAGASHAVSTLREIGEGEDGPAVPEAAELPLATVLRGLGTPAAGATLPAGLHAGMVRASDACFGCNVCETLCPTAALRREVEGAATRLLFSPARCTGCGVCGEACLPRALTITAAGEGAPLSLSDTYLDGGEVELVEVAPRACGRCGVPFTGLPGELCDTCLTTARGAGRLRGLGPTPLPLPPGALPSTPSLRDGRLN